MRKNPTRGIVVAVWLCAVLAGPLLDPTAERDPYHTHIVIGGDAASRQQALIEHHHRSATSPTRVTHPESHLQDGVRVLSIGILGVLGPLVVGMASLVAAIPSSPQLSPPSPGGHVLSFAFLLPAGPTLPVPEPPPRPA
ncbi:MAG: hypothetical protein QN163_08490 [Armatimonadota bacterium]|nr:hypothetical protein [Armatimonadota bacterium]